MKKDNITLDDTGVIVKNLTDKMGKIYRQQQSRMNITIWMNIDGNEEEITTLYDVYSDPFEVGDILHIGVEELYEMDLKRYRLEIQANFEKENIRRRELFGNKWIMLMSKQKYVKTKMLDKDRIEIEYFAQFTEKPLR